jgi:tetratricopeptide (TPR) repeat protein
MEPLTLYRCGMAALPPIIPGHRAGLAFVVSAGLLLGGCSRHDTAEAVVRAAREAEAAAAAQQKLAETEKALAARSDALALADETRSEAERRLAQASAALAERDTQLRAAQAELEALKKRDAFVFAEARALQQQARNILAVAAYEKFLKEFPTSDFAPLATSAISELQAQTQRDQQRWAAMTDPKAKEREMQNLFRDGLLTPKELAPWIKKKNRAQVIALLGKPSHLFPGGSEIGYNDKITNPATGRRSMLVITFDADIVSALRAEYAGQRFIP